MPFSRHVPLSGHVDVAFFKWCHQWHWINTKIYKYVIITSLNSESACKLINRIPGLCLLILSSPGPALRTHVLKALHGKLDTKRHSPCILYVCCLFDCGTIECLSLFSGPAARWKKNSGSKRKQKLVQGKTLEYMWYCA